MVWRITQDPAGEKALKQSAGRSNAVVMAGGNPAMQRDLRMRLPVCARNFPPTKSKLSQHIRCRIQQNLSTGGARPCTSPLRPLTTARVREFSTPKRDEDGSFNLIPSEKSGARNTRGVEIDPAGRALSKTWDTLQPSRYFTFLIATWPGNNALQLNTATSTKTHGINADGTRRLSEDVIGSGLGS